MREFLKNIKKLKKYCNGQSKRIIMLFVFSLFMVILN